MAVSDQSARRQLLANVATAIEHLGDALAALTAAHELLDDQQAERLEEELFRPVQRAYGRAKRTHTEFAGRSRLPRRNFNTPTPKAPSTGVKGFVEHAAEAVDEADRELVTLQDSLMPVEVGDPELRAGLSEVRRTIDGFGRRARGFVSGFGR
ncbi:MAG TPA: hypothetical protein VHX88_01985 [Solirubrobacteraceae bacterium]|jgi:hypothetical protein|nr:hypothetical protein [Solirubrobacteraceae bacterium]